MNIKVTAERKTVDTVFLQWVSDDPRERTDYDIYFAPSDTEQLRKIDTVPTYNFIHNSKELIDNHRIRYEIGKGASRIGPIYPENNGDKYLYALADQYCWQLKYALQGVPCDVYCYTNTDNYCPECWSKESNKQIKTKCNTCDGSGRYGGYTGPVKCYISIMDGAETDNYVGGVSKPRTILRAWLGNIPLINKNDIIVDSLKRVFRVTGDPERTTAGSEQNTRFIVKQTLLIEKLDDNQKFYQTLGIGRANE